MYIIYEIKGKKIGCTVASEFDTRQKVQRKLGKMIILEIHNDITLASNREIELQKKHGYRVDAISYERWTKVISPKGRTKELNKQRGETLSKKYKGNPRNLLDAEVRAKIPYKELGKLTSKRQKGKPQIQLHTKEARQKRILKMYKQVSQYTKDNIFVKTYPSLKQAEAALNIHRCSISANARGVIPSAGGYLWRYE